MNAGDDVEDQETLEADIWTRMKANVSMRECESEGLIMRLIGMRVIGALVCRNEGRRRKGKKSRTFVFYLRSSLQCAGLSDLVEPKPLSPDIQV